VPSLPQAKRVPHSTTFHGGQNVDEWHWLQDRDDPDTVAYLKAEKEYADRWFEQQGELREQIFEEIRSRTLETDLSVPVQKGSWWYYSRTVEGLSYPIHCRRSGPRPDTNNDANNDNDAPEQILLDENLEAEGHDYQSVGAFDVSPGGARLAWSADRDGSELYELRIRDLSTGTDLPDAIAGTYYGTAWSADEQFLFYVRPDDAMRPYQVWRHQLGSDVEGDQLVYEETDERFFLDIDLTRSGRFVVIEAASKTTSETRLIDSSNPTDNPWVVDVRRADHEYSVDHWNDRLVITTNWEAEDFRVMTTPLEATDRSQWTELLPARPNTRVVDVAAFATHLVVSEWCSGLEQLRIVWPDTSDRLLTFDETVYSVGMHANPEYTTSALRFGYESMLTPSSVYEEDVLSGERALLKQKPVLGGVDLSRYVARREWATSADGTRVPLDIVRHRDTPEDGTAAALLYGYGAYEISIAPYFSVARLSLLDRGAVFALAHPRGGGELGRQWYLQGKLLAKRNSFEDFIACAEHLVAQRIASPHRVVIRGGSAGGLLVGASVTMRPELFAGVVAEVPFVDVVNTMLDETLPLTITEWEEWGDPKDPLAGAYIASYTPYENVQARDYPSMYVTAGLNDPRVSYHEPAKWVAKLRAISTGDRPLLFRTEMGAGHGGPSGRYESWRDEARTLSYVLWASTEGGNPRQ
jgi:oligopeptidase B